MATPTYGKEVCQHGSRSRSEQKAAYTSPGLQCKALKSEVAGLSTQIKSLVEPKYLSYRLMVETVVTD